MREVSRARAAGGTRDRRPDNWWTGETRWRGKPVSRFDLDTGVVLGRQFMLASQRRRGNFVYEYDWRSRLYTDEDNQVRQAGATWGLALLHRAHPGAQTRAALLRALDFWRAGERVDEQGRRWPLYPGDGVARLGTLALIALAHIELLRTDDGDADARADWLGTVHGCIAQILRLRDANGRIPDIFDAHTGEGIGEPSPYSEGEALLALCKAARHAGCDDLWSAIDALAEAGYDANVRVARAEDADSDTTKGFYQWASMSWHEIIGAGRDRAGLWSGRLLELAVWMIDTHRILERRRNTAYAFEGLVCAFDVARRNDDPRRDKLDRVIRMGLRNLSRWQVGHHLANAFVADAPADDPHALGGVQNSRRNAALRIDVAQHQTHALLLALDMWVGHTATRPG